MAFDLNGLDKQSASANTDCPVLWGYVSDTDNMATIQAANYFLPAFEMTDPFIASGELIYVKASDGIIMLTFDVVDYDEVTTAEFIPPDNPTEVFFAGAEQADDSGGTTGRIFLVSAIGSPPGGQVVATIKQTTNPTSIKSVVTNHLSGIIAFSVYFGTDPGATCILNWLYFAEE